MQSEAFLARIKEYRLNEERRMRGFKIVAIYELAPGVVLLEDRWRNSNDFSVLFDNERWSYAHPRDAERNKPACACKQPELISHPIERFFGFERSPPARSLEETLAYAKSHLRCKVGAEVEWYGERKTILQAA